jgi:pyruvate kinase
VQSPDDVESVRDHTRLPLIAKMEKPEAVKRAAEILQAADYVMVARVLDRQKPALGVAARAAFDLD